MKYLLVAILVLHYCAGICQKPDSIALELDISKDTISCGSKNHKLVVEYYAHNVSETNLILYRLGSEVSHFPSSRIDVLCDKGKTSAGIVFILFNENLKWKTRTHWIVSDYSRPMTKERADSAMAAANARSLKSTVILKKGERMHFRQEIDLTPFNLAKGRYYLQLTYYAGRRIDHFVSERQLLSDKENYQAEVYQGCARSKRVTFEVN